MRSTCIWCMMCFCMCSYAQKHKSIPGYMGSRNALCIKVTPNITDPLFPSFGFDFERAISRRSSISVSAGTMNGMMTGDNFSKFRGDRKNNLVIKPNNKAERVWHIREFLTYRNSYFSVAKSYYRLRNGSIAPQGKFLKLGLTFNFFKVSDDQLVFAIEDGSSYKNPNKNSKYQTRSMGSFNIEYGSKRFFSKHFFLHKAIAFNIPFTFWSTSNSKVYYNIEDFNESSLAFYIANKQTFNVSLGIGIAF